MNFLMAAVAGLLSGVTSGLFGVGGGIVMVPLLLLLFSPPIRDIKEAIGTSLVVIIPTALMGSYRHHTVGNINWQVVWWLVPSAVVGSYLGVWLTTQVSADNLKRMFGVLLIGAGAKLLFFK